MAKQKDLDALFEKHLKDDFSDVSVDEFGHMLNEETFSSKGNDSLDCRFDYFMDYIKRPYNIDGFDLNYQDGFKNAVSRYIDKAELNKSDMYVVDSVLLQEIGSIKINKTNSNMYVGGYFQGLKLVKAALNDSKRKMMSKIAKELSEVLG